MGTSGGPKTCALDGGDGLSHRLLAAASLGQEILPMWQWTNESDIAGSDRMGEIRLGQQHLPLAQADAS
ncbi:hypothetical protein ACF09E_35545 [Streptomyces sp. NPDC014891]|uniref:hypothetical protein n=1 Tax=Streptomyces sp. NPDC014891 TaxID=3364929 RepID=UPI0036F68447